MTNHTTTQSWKITAEKYVQTIKNNPHYLGAALACLLVAGGGFYFYRSSVIKQEEAAYAVLSDCLAEYDQAASGASEWKDVSAMCQSGYEKYGNTKVAPYILDIQVDALLAQDKKEEAMEILSMMLSKVGNHSPLYSLYKLKLGLLKTDIADDAIKTAGIQDLEQLAADSHNQYRDVAQFYLGSFYREQGQKDKAVTVWKELVALNENLADKQSSSPWAAMAQEKLNGLA
jgi:tetratricopeptide (TPR) repeat protein